MLPASRLSCATLLAITSLCTACAARYSVPSEQLSGRDLTRPVEVLVDGKTSTTRVIDRGRARAEHSDHSVMS